MRDIAAEVLRYVSYGRPQTHLDPMQPAINTFILRSEP
jgi:hypothetical protein